MYEARSSELLFLFDLENDPNETINLARTETRQLKKLMKKVRAIIKSGEVAKPDTPFLRNRSLPRYWGGVVSPGWCRAHWENNTLSHQWSYEGWQNFILQSQPIATLAPQARQARASGENLNYIILHSTTSKVKWWNFGPLAESLVWYPKVWSLREGGSWSSVQEHYSC